MSCRPKVRRNSLPLTSSKTATSSTIAGSTTSVAKSRWKLGLAAAVDVAQATRPKTQMSNVAQYLNKVRRRQSTGAAEALANAADLMAITDNIPLDSR